MSYFSNTKFLKNDSTAVFAGSQVKSFWAFEFLRSSCKANRETCAVYSRGKKILKKKSVGPRKSLCLLNNYCACGGRRVKHFHSKPLLENPYVTWSRVSETPHVVITMEKKFKKIKREREMRIIPRSAQDRRKQQQRDGRRRRETRHVCVCSGRWGRGSTPSPWSSRTRAVCSNFADRSVVLSVVAPPPHPQPQPQLVPCARAAVPRATRRVLSPVESSECLLRIPRRRRWVARRRRACTSIPFRCSWPKPRPPPAAEEWSATPCRRPPPSAP